MRREKGIEENCMARQFKYGSLLFGILTFIGLGCSSSEPTLTNLDHSFLKDIGKAEIRHQADTSHILIHDESFVFDTDYLTWRINYLLWRNKTQIKKSQTYVVNVISHQGEGDNAEVIYSQANFDTIHHVFSTNQKYRDISSVFLNELGLNKSINVVKAHNFLNENSGDGYTAELPRLFFDLADCQGDTCLAFRRARFMTEMIAETGVENVFNDTFESVDSFMVIMNKIFQIASLQPVENN